MIGRLHTVYQKLLESCSVVTGCKKIVGWRRRFHATRCM